MFAIIARPASSLSIIIFLVNFCWSPFFYFVQMTTLSVSPMPPRMNSHVQEVMSLIGWNEKAYVPIANAANRQLMDDIRRMQHDHEHKSMLDEQLRDRVEWLKQHLDNSGQDIQRNLVGDFPMVIHSRNTQFIGIICSFDCRCSSMCIAANARTKSTGIVWR